MAEHTKPLILTEGPESSREADEEPPRLTKGVERPEPEDEEPATSSQLEKVHEANARYTLRPKLDETKGPAIMHEIPRELNEKAKNNNADLTDEERALLLSRADLIGKALANPDSLTLEEVHEILQYPPPDVVRANIQRATNNALSTPEELYAKIKHAMDNGQFNDIGEKELRLLGGRFCDPDYPHGGRKIRTLESIEYIERPGYDQAYDLLRSRHFKFDREVMTAAFSRYLSMKRGLPRISGLGQKESDLIPADLDPNGTHVRYDQEDLDIIVDDMTYLDQQRDRGRINSEEFFARYRRLLTSLQTLAQRRHDGPHTPGFDTVPKTWPGPGVPWTTPNEFIVLPEMSLDLTRRAISHLYDGIWAWKPSPHSHRQKQPDSQWEEELEQAKEKFPAAWKGGEWPPFSSTQQKSPVSMLADDMWEKLGIDEVGQGLQCWEALRPEIQDQYVERSEALRQEAWDYFEKRRGEQPRYSEMYPPELVRQLRAEYPLENRSQEARRWKPYLPRQDTQFLRD